MEYKEFKPKRRDLDGDLKDLADAAIIVEDFVRQRDKEGRSLLKVLGYLKRHNRCDVFVNTYMLSSTGATTLLNLFDKVVFTRHPANWRSLRTFCRLYPIEELDEGRIKDFLAGSRRYLEIDLRRQSLRVLGDDAKENAEKEEKFSQTKGHLESLLTNFPEPELLSSILKFLQRNVDLDKMVDPRDFSITLRSQKRQVRVSLLDFLLAVREERKPSSDIALLYKLFTKKLLLPRSFVSNTYLQRLSQR